MKDFLSKIFVLRLNWMLGFLYLILVNELTASVIATKLLGKSCFLYPINEDEPSPWFSIQRNHDTTVILENMPLRTPVNITLNKYQSEDAFCLLSVRLHKIDIYGSCLLDDQQIFSLDDNIDDKTLVFHVRESIFHISVEDVMVKLNPLMPELSELTHDMPEWMDKEDLAKENAMPMNAFDDNQYVIQITSDIAEENRLHAAVGCEYGDECIMEFDPKTVLVIKNEITLMALSSNSTKLEGEVYVHYGKSDFKRIKPLVLSLPLRTLEEVDTWEEVADVSPEFLDREGSESYILYLDKNLIYSPNSPGLVGTVRKKELILDFRHTKNVIWGVPCPEKPESLDLNFSVITTTPENDAEIFIPDGSNEEMKSDMLTSMVQGELDQIKAIIDSSTQPDLEELELERGFEPVFEAQLEPIPEMSLEPGDNDGPEKSALVKSNSMSNTPEAIILMSMHLIVILTRSLFF